MGFWIAFLLLGSVDCGSGARLESGQLITPQFQCALPGNITHSIDSCAWHAPGRLLYIVAGLQKRIFFINCNKNTDKNCNTTNNTCMKVVRDGRTDTANPWHFDVTSGEVYQEYGQSCNGKPFRINRERYTPNGWLPVQDVRLDVNKVREIQAVRSLPTGIVRKPWFDTPLPDVVEPRMDVSEEMPAPVRIGDFNAQTAWIGENPKTVFIYTLPSYFPAVRAISILPGHGGSAELQKYARIRTLRVTTQTQVMRVRFPEDPARMPGSLHVPWHVMLDAHTACIEIAIEDLYPGEKPAISEIALYTDMDFAHDPAAFFVANIATWPPTTSARVARGFDDAQLAHIWKLLAPEHKPKVATEIARRSSTSLLEAQIEMLAWANSETLSLLARTLARPDAKVLLQEKLKTVRDPTMLERLLVPFLALGKPDAHILDVVLTRHPQLSTKVRDGVNPTDQPALAQAWCSVLPQRLFVVNTWARHHRDVREIVLQCLQQMNIPKHTTERIAFLRAAATFGDPRLKSRVIQELHQPEPQVVRLYGIQTLLHLQPTTQELAKIARTKRPDEQWILLTHWPQNSPILQEIANLARSPWPPVAQQALWLLADRCHPDFPKFARHIVRNPKHENWFEVLAKIHCHYNHLRKDLLDLLKRKLSVDALAALAHVFAMHGEKQTASFVEKRLYTFFAQQHNLRYLEEHATEGIRLLWALAAYERSQDTGLFLQLARRRLPEPYLEALSLIVASRCKTPVFMPARVWRRPSDFSAFLDACMKESKKLHPTVLNNPEE